MTDLALFRWPNDLIVHDFADKYVEYSNDSNIRCFDTIELGVSRSNIRASIFLEMKIDRRSDQVTAGRTHDSDVVVTERYRNLLIVSYGDNCISFLSSIPPLPVGHRYIVIATMLARFRGLTTCQDMD